MRFLWLLVAISLALLAAPSWADAHRVSLRQAAQKAEYRADERVSANNIYVPTGGKAAWDTLCHRQYGRRGIRRHVAICYSNSWGWLWEAEEWAFCWADTKVIQRKRYGHFRVWFRSSWWGCI